MASDTILIPSILCVEDLRFGAHRYGVSRNAVLIQTAIGHFGPALANCGYIVVRNELLVHYFVSNISSLKVITNFIY